MRNIAPCKIQGRDVPIFSSKCHNMRGLGLKPVVRTDIVIPLPHTPEMGLVSSM